MTSAPLTAPKQDGFIVEQDIATHTDRQVTPEGMLDIEFIHIELRVTYPKGFDLKPHEQDIQRAIVALAAPAYVELERRSK